MTNAPASAASSVPQAQTTSMPASEPDTRDLTAYCDDLARRARAAAGALATARGAQKDQWLLHSAAALEDRAEEILQANARDLAAGGERGLTSAALDRLRLN